MFESLRSYHVSRKCVVARFLVLMHLPAFDVLAIIAIAFLLLMMFFALVRARASLLDIESVISDIESADFLRTLNALSNATAHANNRIDVLANGDNFYKAELESDSRRQTQNKHRGQFFQKGKRPRMFSSALDHR